MTQPAIRRRKVEMPSGIRKKFTAALSMLLVAAILMVGSTYAWFTLSTAPEVKGITTSIGANGNLEIMLLDNSSFTSTADNLGVNSNIGDSIQTADQTLVNANLTWGNLIDLSDPSYGLSSISLSPVALNVTNPTSQSGFIVTSSTDNSFVKIPDYGSDGRVYMVNRPASTGRYIGANQFGAKEDYAGVRALGLALSVTARTAAYSTAVGAIDTYSSAAKTAAAKSLDDYGEALGTLLVKIANDEAGNGVYTYEEMLTLKGVVDALAVSNNNLLDSIKNAVIAYLLSSYNNTELTDEQVTGIQNAVNAVTVTNVSAGSFDAAVTAASPDSENPSVTSLPEYITDALNHYLSIKEKLTGEEGAKTVCDNLVNSGDTDTQYSQNQVKSVFDKVIDKTHTSVANTVNPGRDDAQDLADAATAGTAVEIKMLSGSGVYYDIAKAAGNFNSKQLQIVASYQGITVRPKAVMYTGVESTEPILLTVAYTNLQNKAYSSSDENATSSGASMVTPYAYMIDFGFRTNASGANLLLQSDSAQRIYSDSTNEETKGEGSFIEFTSYDISKFSVVKMRKLIGAIRVAFVTPGENGYELLAIAVPDVEKVVENNLDTYPGITESKSSDEEDAVIDTLTVKLALYNYSFEPVLNEAPKLVLGAKKTGDGASVISSLIANKGKKISAIVFLDGDSVDNTMVANAKTSMSGKLNLQFTTDKALVPMENAALRNGNVVNHTADEVTQQYTAFTGKLAQIGSGDLDAWAAIVDDDTTYAGLTKAGKDLADASYTLKNKYTTFIAAGANATQADINDVYDAFVTANAKADAYIAEQ